MIWQHHSRLRWFCTDISPLTIEVKAFKKGGAAWRVKSDAGTFFQGKCDHPMDAMQVGTKHALEIAKRYETPVEIKSNMEISDLEISPGINEDVTVLPGEPSTTDH